MKQTAVQWYADKQESLQGIFSLGAITATEYYEKLSDLVKEAMELEKEQMFAYTKNRQVIGEYSQKFFEHDFEQYYKEIYGRESI
jgi:hypothetical protein